MKNYKLLMLAASFFAMPVQSFAKVDTSTFFNFSNKSNLNCVVTQVDTNYYGQPIRFSETLTLRNGVPIAPNNAQNYYVLSRASSQEKINKKDFYFTATVSCGKNSFQLEGTSKNGVSNAKITKKSQAMCVHAEKGSLNVIKVVIDQLGYIHTPPLANEKVAINQTDYLNSPSLVHGIAMMKEVLLVQ